MSGKLTLHPQTGMRVEAQPPMLEQAKDDRSLTPEASRAIISAVGEVEVFHPDVLAEKKTEIASDDEFARFGPVSDELPAAAVSHPIKRAALTVAHTVELMGGGKGARHPELVERRKQERRKLGMSDNTL